MGAFCNGEGAVMGASPSRRRSGKADPRVKLGTLETSSPIKSPWWPRPALVRYWRYMIDSQIW
jgi:hypothetical protein